MCGILGGFWRSPTANLKLRATSALDEIMHRGPDDRGLQIAPSDTGTVVLGQTRLSIIDLSARGHQPMQTNDGALTIVYNGEIYNYRELRQELRQLGRVFSTQSDTEVLLAAWAEWGSSCLRRLEGMFAFAVYDRAAQTLTCVRDAFGIKPLFVKLDGKEFLFASEMRAMRTLCAERARPDLQRAYDYMVHGDYDSQRRTFVDGVEHLPPGSLIKFDLSSGGFSGPDNWWLASAKRPVSMTFDQAVEATREQFLRNVKLHLRSDVPLGAALSGGVDSSAIVCAMRYLEPRADLHTFSYIAEDARLSEEKWVDLVNDTVGACAHTIHAGAHDLVRDLDDLIRAQGEPFGSTSIYAQYLIYQKARAEGITVTLDGQGADELLAGYNGFPGQRMLSLFESGRLSAMHRFARSSAKWPGRSYRRTWMEFGRVVLPDWAYSRGRKTMGRDFRPRWLDIETLTHRGVQFRETRPSHAGTHRGKRVIEQLAYNLQVRGLPHLLRHGDRNAMAFSIESRVPFLTWSMAELMLGMPENYLISDNGESKCVFRSAMRGIVPDAILDRRDKVGFATPELAWLREIAPLARNWLKDTVDIPFLNTNELTSAFDQILTGRKPFDWRVWRWINYARWYRLQDF